MHAPLLAAVFAAACLLSACGFVPPAPPTPGDGPRVAINQSDPRKTDTPATLVTAPPPTTVGDLKPSGPAQAGNAIADAAIPIPAAPPASPTSTSGAANIAPTITALAPEPIKAAAVVLTTSVALPTLPTTGEPAPATGDAGPSPTPPEAIESAPAPDPIVPKPVWHIQPEDGTVRQAIARWAAKSGWTFGPDQWELDFDLPIQAPAQFEADSFKEATQALSEAIAMTESPVRPCFYANRVLRVIPFTRSCNRAAPPTPSP